MAARLLYMFSVVRSACGCTYQLNVSSMHAHPVQFVGGEAVNSARLHAHDGFGESNDNRCQHGTSRLIDSMKDRTQTMRLEQTTMPKLRLR